MTVQCAVQSITKNLNWCRNKSLLKVDLVHPWEDLNPLFHQDHKPLLKINNDSPTYLVSRTLSFNYHGFRSVPECKKSPVKDKSRMDWRSAQPSTTRQRNPLFLPTNLRESEPELIWTRVFLHLTPSRILPAILTLEYACYPVSWLV